MSNIVVLGGGVAGLTAARHLAMEDIDVQVFERRGTVGGRVQTSHNEGFTLDRGFQVLFTAYPAVRAELNLDALELRSFTPGATIVRPDHRSVLSDPIRDPGALVQTVSNTDVRFVDKLRILLLRHELIHRSAADIFSGTDTSIESYLTDRGFSRQFVQNFAAPFYGGITLDRSLSASKAVFEYTFKMLANGAIAIPAAGMNAIPAQLADNARRVGAEIVVETPATAVETTTEGVSVILSNKTIAADAVIVATDPWTAAELTDVETIPTEGRGCVTQYYSLPAGDSLATGKRLLLNAHDNGPNHVAPLSAVAPEYAPDDATLLSVTFLGEREESNAELAVQTRSALSSWYPERQFDTLSLLRTDRIDHAQFAQQPGFYEKLPEIDAPSGAVYLAGDYTRWSSINGAVESGRAAARTVATKIRDNNN